MLIPRFSLRWLLGLTTLCAGMSLVVSLAVRGQAWAIGATAGLATLAVIAALFITAFLVAWLIAQVERALFRRGPVEGVSPFADDQPPDSPFRAGDGTDPTAGDTPSPLTG